MLASRAAAGLAAGLALLGAGCGRLGVPEVAMPGSGSDDMRRLLEDRVWIATDAEAAPGTLRLFLSDGTLVMMSCAETYRLAPWRWVEDARLVWEEDGAVVRAEVVLAERRTLVLAVEAGGPPVPQSFRAGVSPEVCPDLPG
jgi:hypothetical protein